MHSVTTSFNLQKYKKGSQYEAANNLIAVILSQARNEKGKFHIDGLKTRRKKAEENQLSCFKAERWKYHQKISFLKTLTVQVGDGEMQVD